jgi:hypothetical protein
MKADIYQSVITRNPDNGMVTKVWSLKESVPCFARGILGSQLGGNSAQVELKDYVVLAKDFVKIRTSSPISSEYRVSNIRTGDNLIWSESYIENTAGGLNGATIFEPSGTTPLIDFSGKVMEYETVLKRQEVQSLEID